MPEIIYALIGALVGAVIAWIVAVARARSASAAAVAEAQTRAKMAQDAVAELESQIAPLREELDAERDKGTKARVQLDAERKNLDEQKALLNDAQEKLTDTFKALSGDALKNNSQALIEMARKSLETVVETAKGDLKTRQESIKGLVQPVQETLKRYQEQAKSMEDKRQEDYGSMKEQISNLAEAEKELRKETGNLVAALKNPQARGRWGEVTLRRVVELSGMSGHCDFIEQSSTQAEGGAIRPDMIVQLPSERIIVIDAKVPLSAYLDAMDESDADKKQEALEKHARQVRDHVKLLSGKKYWDKLPDTLEFVVLFLPGESFFSAAVECDRSIIEDALEKRIVIATATTLFSVLRAVEYGWRQQNLAQNAKEISNIGKKLYRQLRIMAERLGDIQGALEKTVKAYNRAVGSFESRLFPAARQFRELGAGEGDELPQVTRIEVPPRKLQIPEVAGSEEQEV